MREQFQQELAKLNLNIVSMAELVETSISKATKAFLMRDINLARNVIDGDPEINNLELLITDECTNLIALEQPVASDLREIIAYLKVVSDMERIGDYSVHIAKLAGMKYSEVFEHSITNLIPQMLDLALDMFVRSIDALVHKKENLAREIATMDGKMDLLTKQTHHYLISLIEEGSPKAKKYVNLLSLSRFLERLGDHVVHICSWAVYNATGEREEFSSDNGVILE